MGAVSGPLAGCLHWRGEGHTQKGPPLSQGRSHPSAPVWKVRGPRSRPQKEVRGSGEVISLWLGFEGTSLEPLTLRRPLSSQLRPKVPAKSSWGERGGQRECTALCCVGARVPPGTPGPGLDARWRGVGIAHGDL